MLGLAVRMECMVVNSGWLFLIPIFENFIMLFIVVTALRQSDQMVAESWSVLLSRCRAEAIAKSSIWYGLLVWRSSPCSILMVAIPESIQSVSELVITMLE